MVAHIAHRTSVSVSVETRRSDDLYTGASPDGDGVEAERWPLLGGDGERKEMWGEADGRVYKHGTRRRGRRQPRRTLGQYGHMLTVAL